MGVHDRAKIFINAMARDRMALAFKPQPRFVGRLQVLVFQPLDRRQRSIGLTGSLSRPDLSGEQRDRQHQPGGHEQHQRAGKGIAKGSISLRSSNCGYALRVVHSG